MDIVSPRKIYYLISSFAILTSILALGFWGLGLGIDFKGGSNLELEWQKGARPQVSEIFRLLKPLNLHDLKVTPVETNGFMLRFAESDEKIHNEIMNVLKEEAQKNSQTLEERRFSSIGPTIGRELKRKAIGAIGAVLLGISVYIAWAFRKVSRPISSWRYGVATLIALFHDVIIPVGLFSWLWYFREVEIDSNFIVALLVVLGFSVHDTIVVFDRIRENLKRYSGSFPDIVNRSINETLVRSINTSLTVLLTLASLYFLGGETLRNFTLTLLVGIFSGTYSSIFIASPILVTWYEALDKRKKLNF